MVLLFGSSIVASILAGSLYTLVAVGITLTFAVTRIANFAHGELVTIGAYVGAIATQILVFPLSLLVGVVVAFVVSGSVITSVDEVLFKPLTRKGATPLMLMIASFAVSMTIKYSLYVITGSLNIMTVMSQISVTNVYVIGDGAITNVFLWAVPTTVICVLALELIFVATKTGKAMRAMAENVSLATATGINVYRIRRLTWFIGGGLAGVAGSFWSIFSQTTPEIGWLILLRGFAASVIGGLSSFSGTIVGGYIVGFSENLVMDIMNRYLGVNVAFKPTIMFILMIVFLMFKPTGLVVEYTNIRENLQKILRKVGFGR